MRTVILFAPLSYDSDASGPRRAERVSALERTLAPLERTGDRGSAVTILMRKEP